MTRSALTQIHILDRGLAHTTSCTINVLLDCARGLVLWNDGSGILMTLGNNRISKRSFNEGPVMMLYHDGVPETRGFEPDHDSL